MGNYKQLSIEERSFIQAQLILGFKTSWIAVGLGRSVSTISRELRRNGWVKLKEKPGRGRPAIAGKYRAVLAQGRADGLSVKPRVERRLQSGNVLWNAVMDYLRLGYSPEQIAGTLKTVNADHLNLQVSHETIYSAIYLMPRGELRTEAIGWLRFGHAKRRPKACGEYRRGQIPDMVSIHDRTPEVDERLVPGHWEGDLIKGKSNRTSVGTIVERTTLFTVLAKMEKATAESAVNAFSYVLNRIEAQKRL
jgi:IS30 family transposase